MSIILSILNGYAKKLSKLNGNYISEIGFLSRENLSLVDLPVSIFFIY